ncbi:MAG TPA: hypothetical protein VMI73_08770 [Trebonia sp.]|nr:hypothetical protein [Trebonia sp.]
MTDGGTAFQPGQTEPSLPFRSRGAYAGHDAFGAGAGAVLVDPEVAHDLRSAAEFATQAGRIAGGLLYGRAWTDDEGPYLVVDGYLESGPGENPHDRIIRDGQDNNFTLTDADLRLLRQDAARMYSAALEVGWWRSLPAPGGFNARDYLTQQDLIEPGGVGLLVFGSGFDWGTAYLGPDAHPPGHAGTVIPPPRPASEEEPAYEEDTAPELVDIAAGESLLTPDDYLDDELDDDLEPGTVRGTVVPTRQPTLTPAPQPAGPRAISPIRVPSAEWGAKPVNPGNVEPGLPTDVKIVIGALIVVSCAVAAIIGVLLSSAMIAVIIAVVGFLAITTFVAVTRL